MIVFKGCVYKLDHQPGVLLSQVLLHMGGELEVSEPEGQSTTNIVMLSGATMSMLIQAAVMAVNCGPSRAETPQEQSIGGTGATQVCNMDQ